MQASAALDDIEFGLLGSWITIWFVSIRLRTERLVIRTFDHRTLGAWVAMFNDPEVVRFLPPGPALTIETFEGRTRVAARDGARDRLRMWAVDDARTGTFIGQCGIRPANSMDPDAGLGDRPRIPLRAERRGTKDLRTEAAIAVLAHGLGPIGLGSIIAVAEAGERRLVAGHGESRDAL